MKPILKFSKNNYQKLSNKYQEEMLHIISILEREQGLIRRRCDDPNESEIKKAIEVLVSELNKDDGYRYGWQANIAMAFFDACVQEGIQFPQLHDVSNNAAKQFLRNLCRERECDKVNVNLTTL